MFVLYFALSQNLTFQSSSLHAPCLRSAIEGHEQEKNAIRAEAAQGFVHVGQVGSPWIT